MSGYDEFRARDIDIHDLLTMLGKLACKMSSPFLPRIVHLLVDFQPLEEGRTRDEATRLTDELIACFKLIMAETELVDEREVGDVWPMRPLHQSKDIYEWRDTNGMDEEEATEESRDAAWKSYRKRMGDLMLSEDAKAGTKHPMAELGDFIKQMADDAENGQLTADDTSQSLDIEKLGRVLSVDTDLSYTSYHQEDGEGSLSRALSWEDTDEDKRKKEIVKDLKRYLTAAISLAQSVGSEAYANLSTCQSLLEKYNGDFFATRTVTQTTAIADLKTFISCLKQARPVLCADCANYKPPKDPPATHTDIEGVKAHMTAEANREIAAKVPKRKRKFGHEGNGHKGPKTEKMVEQRKEFEVYLKTHPVDENHSRITRAHECWQKHTEWEKAASAQGEARGYASYKTLAQAK